MTPRRLLVALVVLVALAVPAVAVAASLPGLPFSASSAAGASASSLAGIWCKLTGGADCQMTGQIRLQAGGTAPQLTWHGSDGFGTASDFGISKVGNAVEIRANRATHNASIGMDSLVLRGQQTAGAPQNFLDCIDGAAGDFCNILSGTTGGTTSYLSVGARIRNVDGSVAAPAYTFASETSSGLYRSAASTVGLAIAGTAETIWTSTAMTPGASGGNTLGTAALPWGGLLTTDGSASAPARSFGSDTNTGAYRVGADAYGIAAGGVLALQVGGGSSGQEQRILGQNDTTGSGGLARGFLHLPRSVGATVVSSPGCSAGSEGAMWFVDDTDDSKPGLLCLCTRRSDNTTVEWVNVSLTAGAASIGTGCTP